MKNIEKHLTMLIAILFAGSLMVSNTSAQSIKEKLKEKANEKVNNIINNGLEGNKNKTEENNQNQENNQNTNENNNENVNNNESQNDQNTKNTEPTLQMYSKYDFVPGHKVIFFEDFAQDNIGDFPGAWNTSGSGEVVNLNNYDGKWLGMRMNSCFLPEVKLAYPDNYTIEFDFVFGIKEEESVNDYLQVVLYKSNPEYELCGDVSPKTVLDFSPGYVVATTEYEKEPGIYDIFFKSTSQKCKILEKGQNFNKSVHFSVWVQKQRLRLYLNEQKILDLPKCIAPSNIYDQILFYADAGGIEDNLQFITNIRIAEGTPDLRNKIFTDGKIVSYGIYFDSGKDVVKAESYGTLKEMAQLLKDNPTLKLKIVGHTDSDGADATNLDLSKRRSVNIKNVLVKEFQIDGSSLETDGLGEGQPITKNDTPSNKALNRRVEFIKLN